jgi:hypothetical protein
MANTTLAKDHHAETRRTARNVQFFHTIAVRLLNCTLLFLPGEDEYSQDRFPAIQLFS